jgi:polyisoprenoid-binding protein YceI
VKYKIVPREGKLAVKAFASGMLSSLAHSPTFVIRMFGGEIELETDGSPRGALRLEIDAESLELVDEFSPRERWDIMHVMQEQILEVSKFPQIVYEAPSSKTTVKSAGGVHYDVNMKGDLSLHGVKRAHPVGARVLLNDNVLRASGELSLRQADFQLKPVTVAGSMMKVKDEVKLTFDVLARK